MKRIICITLSIIIISFVMPCQRVVASQEEGAAEFDYSRVYKVGYHEGFTEFAYDLDSLNNKGYGVEIFDKIQELSNLKFEYVEVKGDAESALHSGEVDLLAFSTKTESRTIDNLFSNIEFGKTYVAVLSEDMDILYGDFEKLDGKTIATYKDHIGNERLEFLGENLGFDIELVYGDLNNFTELDTDFILGYSGMREIDHLNNVLDVGVYSLFVTSTFDNQVLMDKVSTVFYDVAVTEGNFFLELEEKYLASNVEITHRGLLPSEIETLQSRPLEVGYITGFAPISHTNEQGEPDGAMVDTLNALAERYNFVVNYHPYSLYDLPEEHENFDILLTLYGDGEHDREFYETTEPYYFIPLYAQVNRDRIDSTARLEIFSSAPKIGILPYQTLDIEPFIEEYPGTEFVYYNDWYQLLDDFAAGNLDLMLSTESSTTFAELYFEDLNRATIHADTSVPMQIFVNRDIADEYIPVFNVMLDRMSPSEYDAILEANANENLPRHEMTLSEFISENWYYFALSTLVLAVAFVAMHANAKIKKKEALIESYNTEPLTGFMSSKYFRDVMRERLDKAKPNEYELITLDIDMFKNINIYFSTEKGTDVIIAMSKAMKKAFSETDAIISRRTAEQFLIFRRVDEGGSMRQIYEFYIMPAIKENVSVRYNVTMSFGNVIIDDPKEKITTLIDQSFAANKIGKNLHKTTFVTFDEKMKAEYENKANITFRMDQALRDREFNVEFQPKIAFDSLKIGGAEALVRWTPKLGGKIFPDEFIPVFEENGFISYLDLYVLEEVCKFIKDNYRKLEIPIISVNLSAFTVLSDNIVNRITEVISQYNIEPSEIEFELTESAIESDPEKFLNVVKHLKKIGFAISIDDFGAGVSSLNRLSAVEADILKLDKAFFDLKDQGGKSTVVVTDVINMAKHLDMKVVAEGVETSPQAMWLKSIGCDYAQGYYFAKPMGEDQFKELLVSRKEYQIKL